MLGGILRPVADLSSTHWQARKAHTSHDENSTASRRTGLNQQLRCALRRSAEQSQLVGHIGDPRLHSMADASRVRAVFQQRDFTVEDPDLSSQLAALAASVACSAQQLVKHWDAFASNRSPV